VIEPDDDAVPQAIEGGCLCRAVRYRARREAAAPAYCHCRTCRHTSGAPVVAWITVARDGFSFTRGSPRTYRSSEHVVRSFCSLCGTPLSYEHDAHPDVLDLTTASLDDPARFAPHDHVWTSHAIPWLRIEDDLPRHAEFRPKGESS
jgi:hypothetical protein